MNTEQDASTRVCIVCDQPIDDLRKASGIPAGTGTDLEYQDLAILMHDECAVALSDQLDHVEAEAAILSSSAEAMQASQEMAALAESITNQEISKYMKKGKA